MDTIVLKINEVFVNNSDKAISENEKISQMLIRAVNAQVKMERYIYGLGFSILLTIVSLIVVWQGAKELGLFAFLISFAISLFQSIQIDRCRKYKFKLISVRAKINNFAIDLSKTNCDEKALKDLLSWLKSV